MASEKTEKAEKADKGEKSEKAPREKADKRPRKTSGSDEAPRSVTSTAQAVAPRFAEKYTTVAIPALTKQFGYKNPNQVPRLQKIVLNMGLGQAVTNPKIVDAAVEELRSITGQKPIVTRSKKAIANWYSFPACCSRVSFNLWSSNCRLFRIGQAWRPCDCPRGADGHQQ